MNASPNRWRAIAAFTILASALSAMLAGCTSKTSTVPRRAGPAECRGRTPALAANTALETPQRSQSRSDPGARA